MSYNYEWDGVGLTITTPAGTCYSQGEEGSQLFDELEQLEPEQLDIVLFEYEPACS